MIVRDDLANYNHELLACAEFKDYAPNGLQVAGRLKIKRICSAVSASMFAINEAINNNADALIVHHGYFWKGEAPEIKGIKGERIAKLCAHQINLFAYHLPLDCHQTMGNNYCLAKIWGVKNVKSYRASSTPNLLWTGNFKQELTIDELSNLVTQKLDRKPQVVQALNSKIKKIAWCSGGAQDLLEEAYNHGADAFISGEISLRTYYDAKELNIHYLGCGHHATEKYGVQALGQHLAAKFNLEHEFIDSANPI